MEGLREIFARKNEDIKVDYESYESLRRHVNLSEGSDMTYLQEELIKLALLRTQSDFEKAKEITAGSDFKFHELDTLTLIEGVRWVYIFI